MNARHLGRLIVGRSSLARSNTHNQTRRLPLAPSPSSSLVHYSTTRPDMSADVPSRHVDSTTNFPKHDGSTPGEAFEVRQTSESADWKPDPSKSVKLPPNRQALVDDIIALYSCQPTVDRVKRYTPDCVYDDQFVYANDRYKMAGQWFALPKLFNESKNIGYEIVKNDRDLVQFKNEQSWTFRGIPKTAVINALASLSLDPDTLDSDFVRVKYHKDQANDKDYSRKHQLFSRLLCSFWQSSDK